MRKDSCLTGWGGETNYRTQRIKGKRELAQSEWNPTIRCTQSWVVLGHREGGDETIVRFEKTAIDSTAFYRAPEGHGSGVVPHPIRVPDRGVSGRRRTNLRQMDGGAHEVVVETRDHNKRMSTDDERSSAGLVWATPAD